MIGDAEQRPSLQHALQLFPASLQGVGIRPDARDRGNGAIERSVILEDLVASLWRMAARIDAVSMALLSRRAVSLSRLTEV